MQASEVAGKVEQGIENLKLVFGSDWTWTEIAEWIEARSRAKERLPDYMLVWAYDFLRQRKQQEEMWKD